jgi:hypothetical protein
LKKYYNTENGILERKIMADRAKKRFSIPIYQYSMDMIFIKKWDSAREAAANIGIKHPNIINCTNNKAKTAGGFIWKKNIEINKKLSHASL